MREPPEPDVRWTPSAERVRKAPSLGREALVKLELSVGFLG